LAEKVQKEMSFLDHLEELRWHIIRSIAAIFIIGIGIFLMKTFVFEHIIFAPKKASFATYQFFCSISEVTCFKPPEFDLIVRQLGEQFFVHIKVSLWLGLIIAFPYVFWEIWRFIKPGLYDKEQKAAKGIVFYCSLLFILGVLFGYYVIAPFAITFLAGYQVGETAINSPTLSSYVNYLTMFTVPTGLIFELPIVVYFLARVGLISPEFMKQYRKHAIIIILILAAVITPPDVLTQFLIGIPLFILYEISIIICRRVVKKYHSDD
jgi:sec-independent protein translocase protein TatC